MKVKPIYARMLALFVMLASMALLTGCFFDSKPQPVILSGKVIGTDGKPVAGSSVSAWNFQDGKAYEKAVSTTGADGAFSMEVAPGADLAVLATFATGDGSKEPVAEFYRFSTIVTNITASKSVTIDRLSTLAAEAYAFGRFGKGNRVSDTGFGGKVAKAGNFLDVVPNPAMIVDGPIIPAEFGQGLKSGSDASTFISGDDELTPVELAKCMVTDLREAGMNVRQTVPAEVAKQEANLSGPVCNYMGLAVDRLELIAKHLNRTFLSLEPGHKYTYAADAYTLAGDAPAGTWVLADGTLVYTFTGSYDSEPEGDTDITVTVTDTTDPTLAYTVTGKLDFEASEAYGTAFRLASATGSFTDKALIDLNTTAPGAGGPFNLSGSIMVEGMPLFGTRRAGVSAKTIAAPFEGSKITVTGDFSSEPIKLHGDLMFDTKASFLKASGSIETATMLLQGSIEAKLTGVLLNPAFTSEHTMLAAFLKVTGSYSNKETNPVLFQGTLTADLYMINNVEPAYVMPRQAGSKGMGGFPIPMGTASFEGKLTVPNQPVLEAKLSVDFVDLNNIKAAFSYKRSQGDLVREINGTATLKNIEAYFHDYKELYSNLIIGRLNATNRDGIAIEIIGTLNRDSGASLAGSLKRDGDILATIEVNRSGQLVFRFIDGTEQTLI